MIFELNNDDKNAQIIAKELEPFKKLDWYGDIIGFYLDGCSFFNGYCTKRVFIDAMVSDSVKNCDRFFEIAPDVEDRLSSLGFDAIISIEYDGTNYSGAKLEI